MDNLVEVTIEARSVFTVTIEASSYGEAVETAMKDAPFLYDHACEQGECDDSSFAMLSANKVSPNCPKDSMDPEIYLSQNHSYVYPEGEDECEF